MTAKVLRRAIALLVFFVAISMGATASRAQYDAPMPESVPNVPAPSGSAKAPAAPKVNKAEEAAYKALFEARGTPAANQIALSEDFIKKYPTSHYLPGVYGQLTTAYFSVGDEDKMFVVGTKALELNPDNVDVLSLMAMAMPRRVRATTPDAAQQFDKAEAYARHALELIPNIPKPPEADPAAFEKAKNDKLAMAHSGLGLVHYNHKKFEDARTELMLAVQLASTPDPVDYYLLGNADSQANYYKDAAEAYEKCAVSGPLMAQCKTRAEAAKHDAATKFGR